MAGRAYIGTSGWNYANWTKFYGSTSPSRRLEHYASCFSALEINASHYKLHEPDTYRQWRDRVPDHFRFAVKAHRFLTHNKKLLAIDDHLPRSRDRARVLGHKLAVVLWQLPARFRCNRDRLVDFCRLLRRRWTSARHAIEFRHPSWFDDSIADILAEAGVANCLSDAPDFPLWDRVTTDLVYIRLHGHTRKYASKYSQASLQRWASHARTWLAEDRDVHVYFDNDSEGAAPQDAKRLIALVDGRSSGQLCTN